MFLSLLLVLAAGQITPSKMTTPNAPLPPANPVPYADPDVANVMAPVNAFFAGLSARDAGAMLATTLPEGGATAAVEKPEGGDTVRHMSWADFAANIKPGPEHYQETLTDPAIEVDGDIAMVWSPYVFTIDGKLHHCGTDHFDLVRENGGWKILNVTWSQRTTGCDAGQ
jgi:hypothetical protein